MEIIFKVIESSPLKFRTRSFEVLTLMRSCLTHCSDFSFIDHLSPSLAVKNLIGNFGSYVKSKEEVNWQILTLAAKVKKLDKFLKNAVNTEGKVPGEIANIGSHILPKPDSDNISHKFLCAFKEVYPGLDRRMVEMILEHPLKLGHHSFIDTVTSEVSSISRIMVAQCIVDFVQETD